MLQISKAFAVITRQTDHGESKIPNAKCPMSILVENYYNTLSNSLPLDQLAGLKFESRSGQIGHRAANGSPPLRHIFERSGVACRLNEAKMGPANSLHA